MSVGFQASSGDADGIQGATTSNNNSGLFGHNDATTPAPPGSPGGCGVFGVSLVPNAGGVFGAHNNGGTGVIGLSEQGDGMRGITRSSANNAIVATNDGTTPAPGGGAPQGNAVLGVTTVPNAAGVFGANNGGGMGVFGLSDQGDGVQGRTSSSSHNAGFFNNASTSAKGTPQAGNGVFGLSTVPDASGVFGANNNGGIGVAGVSDQGIGVFAESSHLAGRFEGDVSVTGNLTVDRDIQITGDVFLANTGKDLAERFAVDRVARCDPGMLMVIGEGGAVTPCVSRYDRRAIGVLSGAGALRPAITLGDAWDTNPMVSIALMGTVFCWADAEPGPIAAGDLLTSSDRVGHAMRAADPLQSFGAVVGKALAPLADGQALLPIVIALQ